MPLVRQSAGGSTVRVLYGTHTATSDHGFLAPTSVRAGEGGWVLSSAGYKCCRREGGANWGRDNIMREEKKSLPKGESLPGI